MNLEKLVKEKQLEMEKDMSGDYADNQGKHFEMKKCESGYTISYGGGKKEIEVGTGQAHKLAAACRRLGADDKKELDGEDDSEGKKKLEMFQGLYKGVEYKIKKEGGGFYWNVKGTNGGKIFKEEFEAKKAAQAYIDQLVPAGKKKLAKGTNTQNILKVANQVEAQRAGFFNRNSDRSMTIWFRGDTQSAMENARRVKSAIGSQAASPKFDPQSGLVQLIIKDVYDSGN